MTAQFDADVRILKSRLSALKTVWDGKSSVLELKEADYNWRQMEWWAFYFEYLCFEALGHDFKHPGEAYGTVRFDLRRNVNWDLKSKAIKSDDHKAILNDKSAMVESIRNNIW